MNEAEMKRGAALPSQPHLADSGLLGSSKSDGEISETCRRAQDPSRKYRVVLGRAPGDSPWPRLAGAMRAALHELRGDHDTSPREH